MTIAWRWKPMTKTTTRAVLLLVLFSLLVIAQGGCAHGKDAPPKLTSRPPALAEGAEAIDVAVDWDAHPQSSKTADAKISLTASDGSGLVLRSIDARAVLYGPLAFTEVHLVFANPEPVMREGTFAIALPAGAAVSRFAMKLPQGWQEGEVVERQSARATYETFLRKRVDPAMLEKDTGSSNVFRGRVFPILPRQEKEIVIAYTQTFTAASEPYRLPLVGLPSVEQLDIQLFVPSTKKAFVVHRNGVRPDHDFEVSLAGTPDAVRGGRFAVVRVSDPDARPATSSGAPSGAMQGDLAVLIDSSASRIGTYERDVAAVTRIVGALHPSAIKVACFDQEVEPMASLAEAARRRPAGATDLERGLRWLKTTGAKRAIVLTDGAATTSPLAPAALGAVAKEVGLDRIDAIATGGVRADTIALRALALGGTVVDVEDAPGDVAVALKMPAGRVGRASFEGASNAWPSSLAKAGARRSSALAFVEIAEDKPLRVVMDGKGGAQPRDVTRIDTAPAALIERAVAEAKIRELEDERATTTTEARKTELAREIVSLSVRHRILTELTAMLVLETEADYKRFDIPREAMRDIPVVGPRGVEIVPRGGGQVVLPPSQKSVSPMIDAIRAGDRTADTDRDGIPDADDRCPNEPETFNGFEDDDGCPDRGTVIIESNQILILQMVHFKDGSAEILPESLPIVQALADTLRFHPEFDLVAIIGHTDSRGSPDVNRELSLRRAMAVRAAVVARGVEPRRLIARGVGGAFPIDPKNDAEAFARNRRVEFKILVADGSATGVEVPGLDRALKPSGKEQESVMPSMTVRRGKPAPVAHALSGKLAAIALLLDQKKADDALHVAETWLKTSPDDMLAWTARGQALDALNRSREAARSFGSILELASRPEQRRAAAGWLEALTARHKEAGELAIAQYRRALEERPEQPSSYRLLAWSLVRGGHIDEALATTLDALDHAASFDPRRFPMAVEALKRDAGVLAVAAGKGKTPAEREAILKRARFAGAIPSDGASTTLALTWETDESDLDIHLVPSKNASEPVSVAMTDIRAGYGPEVITLEPDQVKKGWTLAVHQVRRGPQGFAFGKVAITSHDGLGNLSVSDRPFVIMNENAAVSLGTISDHSGP